MSSTLMEKLANYVNISQMLFYTAVLSDWIRAAQNLHVLMRTIMDDSWCGGVSVGQFDEPTAVLSYHQTACVRYSMLDT